MNMEECLKEAERIPGKQILDEQVDKLSSSSGSCPTTTQHLPSKTEPDAEPGIAFFPPLYMTRYSAVADIIRSSAENGMKISKLIDVGCAECKFLQRAIRVPFLLDVAGLDIDKDLLERCKHAVDPLISDYLFREKEDRTVRLYAGSIADRDQLLLQYDVVTAIEVIEHLYPDVLEAMMKTVFGYMRPKLVVMTTPNSEFNVLFPNFSGFRHWDHKFEWTRAQFQQWGDELAEKYSYTVSYSGVGDPADSHSHVGHCSQIATFTRNTDLTPNPSDGILSHTTTFKEVYKVVYPGHHLTEEQQLENDVSAHITAAYGHCDDDDLLPLAQMTSLLERVDALNKFNSSRIDSEEKPDFTQRLDLIERLADIIERTNYKLNADRSAVLVEKGRWSYCSDFQSDSSGNSSGDDNGDIAPNCKVRQTTDSVLVEEDDW